VAHPVLTAAEDLAVHPVLTAAEDLAAHPVLTAVEDLAALLLAVEDPVVAAEAAGAKQQPNNRYIQYFKKEAGAISPDLFFLSRYKNTFYSNRRQNNLHNVE
jgi:hypothetical protein